MLPRERKRNYQGILTPSEKQISYLHSVHFDEKRDEQYRTSLCRAYVQRTLSQAQWRLVSALCFRHRDEERKRLAAEELEKELEKERAIDRDLDNEHLRSISHLID